MGGIEEKVVPLSQLPMGKKAEICKVYAGHGLLTKLSAMGMLPGEYITKGNYGPGPQICTIKGCRYALGRGMADRILVKYKNETK